MIKNIYEVLREEIGENFVSQQEGMAAKTTFKIGGSADVFVYPQSEAHLQFTIKTCRENDVPFFILGNGSNILVSDEGVRGVVVSLLSLNKLSLEGDGKILAQAGASMKDLAEFAAKHNVNGFEFAHGIPGSVGGGVFMNAGAYEGEMRDIFVDAWCIDTQNNFVKINSKDMDFSYRKSKAQTENYVVASALFEGKVQPCSAEIVAKMAELQAKREDKQPLEMPSAGSVFKRPLGHFAGKLIMDAGLRGFSIGGAAVSEKHCGFIVNTGNATAEDVLNLIKHIQQAIKEKFDILLETEIKFVG